MKKDTWYLSFVDENLPEGKRWLGGCYVFASNIVEAASEAWRHKCNPGGEISGVVLEEDFICKPEYMNRLLNKTEIDKALVMMDKKV